MDAVTKWWGNCPIKQLLLFLAILYAWSACSEDKVVTPITADKNCTPDKAETQFSNRLPSDRLPPANSYNRYGHYTPQYRPLSEDISTRYRSFSSPYQSYDYYNQKQNTVAPPYAQRNPVTPYSQPQNTWQPSPHSPSHYPAYVEQPNTGPPQPYYAPHQQP